MGQYYNVVMEETKKDGKRIQYINDYCGAKLMEHSYIGNDFTDFVCGKLMNNPMRVTWYGDYADESSLPNKEAAKFYNENKEMENIWVNEETIKESKNIWVNKETLKNYGPIDINNKYLVNHTLKCYINMKLYCFENDNLGWIVNPLAILTAISNGAGSGDYYGENKEKAGLWAWHIVEFTEEAPKDYEQVEFTFYE